MVNKKFKFQKLIDQHLKILKSLQYSSGLFAASSKNVSTGYDKSWLRDNFYECMAFQVVDDWDTVKKTYEALLQIFIKHEDKIDHAIMHKPQDKQQYIHARFNPESFDEFWEDWGNKQNDAVGAILFKIGRLETHYNTSILKDQAHIRIVNKLVKYLETIEYWWDVDSGMWEENEEVHASSVGACLAGLKSIREIPGIEVPEDMIEKGEKSLRHLLPRESDKKFVDLALLSLIWPYEIVTKKEQKEILENVEYHLLKEKGVIRYKNDYYYNKNPDGFSEEAEWTFGLSWLAIIYTKLNMKNKAEVFIEKMLSTDTRKGIPELYFSNTDKPNENTPLGWSESLFIVALHNYMDKFLISKKISNNS